MNFTAPSSVSIGARRVAPTARMVACGGLMMAENSRTPYMPRLEMALAPPWYSFGLSLRTRARSARSRISAEIAVSDLASALRITGVISPPSIATATPMSECWKRRMRSSAHTALAALQRVPAANAVWAEGRILRFQHSDIGVAVVIEGGLITPVIRKAEVKSLTTISAEMRDLAERARVRKLKPNEYQGGASAISNLGMYGVREFSAIINPPHATILAVGATRRAPIETEDGAVKFISQMTVTLSCDHRVVDGALGGELLAAFKSFVEKPVTALV